MTQDITSELDPIFKRLDEVKDLLHAMVGDVEEELEELSETIERVQRRTLGSPILVKDELYWVIIQALRGERPLPDLAEHLADALRDKVLWAVPS